MADVGAWDRFSESTREWFATAFGTPTAAQIGAWEAIAAGDNALVIAPTGSGKTLAAFGWALDDFQRRPPTGTTRVLYVSPLKALGVDVERNLRVPLAGIADVADRRGQPVVRPSVGVRSGDTSAAERRRLVSDPPDILITTPESLYLMLTSRAMTTLSGVETVIVDEVHAVAGTKRGAHLALSVERVDNLLDRPAQRIGLSATVKPPDVVAGFLGGERPVTIVAPPADKEWDLTVSVPVADMTDLPVVVDDADQRAGILPHVDRAVFDLVMSHRSTIVFCNSRRGAERLTGQLNQLADAAIARAHHGSVAKDLRSAIEEDLKAGRLRCVVATSSLELGIDMGAVDQVVQVESPPSVAAGLQRVGRAGHQVGAASRGVFLPNHRGDVVLSAVAVAQMRSGSIEALSVATNPLDVLAQHTVSAAALGSIDIDDWFDTVRRAAPYRHLPRSVFDATCDMLAGKYPSHDFAELRPRLVWDRVAGTLTGRPGAQRLAVTSGGTIPDRGLFGVYIASDDDGRRVGELDEEMVYESRVGDVIALGATSWRIIDITHDRVLVTPATGQIGQVPFWHGDNLGRPKELGEALGAFQRRHADNPDPDELSRSGLDVFAVDNVVNYLADQRAATGVVPSDVDLVVERFIDELGDWRVVLHSPYGLRIHAPWALAVNARVRERYGMEAAAAAADDGIVVRLPMMDDAVGGAELFAVDPDELGDIVAEQLSGSALFAARFRECAARALLLPRRHPGKRSPLWQQRLRASQLLSVARQYPDFPVILETIRECLTEVYDLPGLTDVARQVARGQIRLVEVTTQTPSPFARTLLFGYVAAFLYESDTPLAERKAAALSVDPTLLAELLGRDELHGLLDPDVVADLAQHLQYLNRPLRGIEGAADLLRMLGPLTADEIDARLIEPADCRELVAVGRAIAVTIGERRVYAAAEDAGRLRDGLGVSLPTGLADAFVESVADPLGDLIGRWARTHPPFSTADVVADLGLPRAVVDATLHAMVRDRRVVAGEFATGQWCDVDVLRRLRRACLAALRNEIEPVAAPSYARFLPAWQHVGAQLTGADGVGLVIEQLAGAPIPASAWETHVFPARVADYHPAMLDELLTSGDAVFAGSGQLGAADGWISLHLADDAPLTVQRTPLTLTPTQDHLLERLGAGAYFWRDLADVATLDDLWALVWAGYLTNDTFAAIRGLRPAKTQRATGTPRVRTRRAGRGGSRWHPRPLTAAMPPGRWSALPAPSTEATRIAHARTEYLLDRYGVLTKGAVNSEGMSFATVYKVAAQMEERGQCRRGYFVDGLGATQFALAGAVDRLRADNDDEEVVLAATDPANPWGGALAWPPSRTGHRPGRKAGAVVVSVSGHLALYVERGAKTALSFGDPQWDRVAHALVAAWRRSGVAKVAIESLDGHSILGTPLAEALLAAGCYSSPSAVRFRN